MKIIKKHVMLIILVAIYSLLCACCLKYSKNLEIEIMQISQQITSFDASKVFLDKYPNIPHSLQPAYNQTPTMSDIEACLGEPQVRAKNNELYFEMRKIQDKGYLFCSYNSLYHLLDTWYAIGLFELDDFSYINANTSSFQDVSLIDSCSSIFVSKKKAYSEHKITNSRVIMFEYEYRDNTWIVSTIKVAEDNSRLSRFIFSILTDDSRQ